ncbi:putative ribosomal N-acetyltransferase YdaF [compost metagenome]
MTSCCRALIHHGFGAMGLNKIEIRARTDNARSRAIPLKLGFQEEGILRNVSYYNDQYYDHVVYGLLRNEWKGNNQY